MRWSLQELYKAWQQQYSFHFKWWRKILFGWGSLRRSIKATIHWIFYGYTEELLWNLDSYFLDVIIMKLTQFQKMEKSGHPEDLNSEEEWHEIIDEMLDKFTKMKYSYYEEMRLDSKMIINPIDKEKGYGTIEFERQEEDELVLRLCYRAQAENNKEALELFSKYFQNLWD